MQKVFITLQIIFKCRKKTDRKIGKMLIILDGKIMAFFSSYLYAYSKFSVMNKKYFSFKICDLEEEKSVWASEPLGSHAGGVTVE